MIARTWRSSATAANAPAYVKHFTETVVPQLEALPGYRSAYLLRRETDGEIELVALTLWESRAAIEAFAGQDIGRAHVESQARAMLTSFDESADHYEVAYG
ncbi:MAG: antibiotic biosynthesis monooxygenase [Reyranella sp.]|uniref:antibiotic biosynthesis monooxygenase family protein n=1 Tax=Reyranella sp. TaxID=1929291 RepID=UPI001ACA9ADA|nr:antibiotic biosynthesis monooxygenase [Reyranella sp.]MBN9090574.1 antibiotic biosynthesis monooxygenase [Reyranella sp.]